jgi:hypothetical protein
MRVGAPSPRYLTLLSSDRAADGPDFARAACIQHHAVTAVPSRPQLGLSGHVMLGTSGTPDRVRMCAPLSLRATPAPPLSILRLRAALGFLQGPD